MRKSTIFFCFLFTLLAVLAVSCTPAPDTAPSAVLTPPPPTPTLRPAPAFTPGDTPVLNGQYLFAEYFVVEGGTSTTSECPGAMQIDFPGYSFADGILDLGPSTLADLTPALGFLGFGQSNTGAMGGGVSSRLETIGSLPYTLPYDLAKIHALHESGEVVVEIQGSYYLLAPGESWVQVLEADPTEDCHRTTTIRFINYGLLDESLIRE